MGQPTNMSGILGKNKFKKTDSHPGLTGTAMINGEVYRVAGWKNTNDSGESYITLKCSESEDKPAPTKKKVNKPEPKFEEEDDFAF